MFRQVTKLQPRLSAVARGLRSRRREYHASMTTLDALDPVDTFSRRHCECLYLFAYFVMRIFNCFVLLLTEWYELPTLDTNSIINKL